MDTLALKIVISPQIKQSFPSKLFPEGALLCTAHFTSFKVNIAASL